MKLNGLRLESSTDLSRPCWNIKEVDNDIEELDIPDEVDGIPIVRMNLTVDNRKKLSLKKIKFPKHFITTTWLLKDSNIEEVDFSECVDLIEIKEEAFKNCKSLVSVKLPPNVEVIKTGAFEGCKNLSDIDINRESINFFGDRSFKGCKGLTELNTNAEISRSAFADTNIQKAHLGGKWIAYDAFTRCKDLGEVTFSDGVCGIDYCCFTYTAIQEVILPKSVEQIGMYAFSDCKSLTSVDLSKTKIEVLESNTFGNCTSLKNVMLPDSLKEIGVRCFSCTALEEIDLKNVEGVFDSAFQYCSSLSFVISRNPDVKISDTAFRKTSLLPY